ncbi:methionine adenosyltransferase [Borrelia turicatae]|uniref:S-adenosylmethionine synthase n=2 Tax=Borrelia turicatae TaxID=142 RepID=A0A172XAZ7_BORTU|nr:methionine adenosyltransferase [Borrelia turicatae]AAX17707.1 S-adenosylmethionine synthetase [Borrelia turicatae 91E135]ANF33855.1 methionine adenosyltransferase [Borrelia turicatae]UPA13223.1 methionine adenosyltransferase [Borrelia turicatae 91E135]UPA14708.1 methionine adenosyltransferase [Borrelia turicatae]
MLNNNLTSTSEAVSEGHPDKIADQISDAILDEILKRDKMAKVACETLVSQNLIIIAGEISSKAKKEINIKEIAKQTIKNIGYTNIEYGLDYKSATIIDAIGSQSIDITNAVEKKDTNDIGAGDQGIIFGYACNETKNFLPIAYELSNLILQKASKLRKSGQIKWLRPDAKSQVTIEYDSNKNPIRVNNIVVSHQHDPGIPQDFLRQTIIEKIIKPILQSKSMLDENIKYYINPSGNFVIGGPTGDTGLTGRKIIADSYGGFARHGGGAYSGKDATKVDRSAAYMARYIAKNMVAAGISKEFEMQLAYAIGIPNPISIKITTGINNNEYEKKILSFIINNFDLTPNGIIKKLKLREPIYSKTCTYGHFGKNELEWEKLDFVDTIKKEFKI